MSVRVSLPGMAPGSYEVRVGSGLRNALGTEIRAICPAHRYVIIADQRVADLYLDSTMAALRAEGIRVDPLTFPPGEASKNREVWAELSDRMLDLGLGRDSAVLALGGGVTGDLAGFVAATYFRGLPLVHLPTSLLAMIDSSVGGKTGVDTPAGKNLIGAFHQPAAVYADTETLATLPVEHLRSGMAEAVKHGAIADAEYFEWIAEHTHPLLAVNSSAMIPLIQRSVQIKAHVVEADEREGGLRKTLNFGHTVGHAVEALSRFDLLHGEAIAMGMVVESRIGERLGTTEPGTTRRLESLLGRLGLPIVIPDSYSPGDILELTRLDKKARSGKVEYALIERIGRAAIGTGSYGTPVDDAVVLHALES